jgi:hypothetical protein
MASPNWSELATTTLANRSRKLADNVLRNNALLNALREGGRVKTWSGGRSIVQEIAYGMNATYKRYSGYEVLNVAPSDVFTAAEFPIRQAAVAVSISGLEMLQNSGKERMIDLLDSRITNAETTFANGISYDIYSDGTAAGQINGLQALISTSPATGIVGGIDRSQWAFWRNVKFSSTTDGSGAATSANIQSYMNRVALQIVRGRDATDLIVADTAYYRLYLESLQAIQRITEDGNADRGAGFSKLRYYGAGRACDVVLDGGFQGYAGDVSVPGPGGAPANTMFFINSSYLFYRPHADRDMAPLEPDRFSVNQDAMVKLIGWAGNLTISNSALQGVLVN